MKTIIKALKLQLSEITEFLQKREETYNSRTARWKASRKGENYNTDTRGYKYQAEELAAVIEKLEDLQ